MKQPSDPPLYMNPSAMKDGVVPPLPSLPKPDPLAQAAGVAGRVPPPRVTDGPRPAASRMTGAAVPSRRPPGADTPPPSVLTIVKEKLRVQFGIREDDPIFAMIEILAKFEKGLWEISGNINASIQQDLSKLMEAQRDMKGVLVDARDTKDSMEQLTASLVETGPRIQMMEDMIGKLQVLSEQITQTGHMDRLIRILSPAISALAGVAVGFIVAFVTAFLLLKR